jgi:uncharacterized protein
MADDSGSDINSSSAINPHGDESTAPTRKRGRPQITPLEDYKDLIVQLFTVECLPIIEIARRLNLEFGLDISERTISRRLTAWDIPRRKNRLPPPEELRERILFHYNKNLNDDEISEALRAEGYDMKARNLARMRQKLGMRRRSRFPEFREYSDEEDNAAGSDSARPKAPKAAMPRKKKRNTSHNAALIPKVTAFVEKYMSNYDGSHDFNHIRRVVGLAHVIYNEIVRARNREDRAITDAEGDAELDLHVITLGALLHDVGDKKYLLPGQDGKTVVLSTLLSFGASEELAIKVQRIVLGVSYSSEIKDPAQVQAMIQKYPELAGVGGCAGRRSPGRNRSRWYWSHIHIWWSEGIKAHGGDD